MPKNLVHGKKNTLKLKLKNQQKLYFRRSMKPELLFQAPAHYATQRNFVKLEHGENVAQKVHRLPVPHERVRVVYRVALLK